MSGMNFRMKRAGRGKGEAGELNTHNVLPRRDSLRITLIVCEHHDIVFFIPEKG